MAIITVKASELYPKHFGDLVKHCHEIRDEQWARLLRTEPSPVQGLNIILDDGCTLQACFPEDTVLNGVAFTAATYEVREQLYGIDADWVRENVGLD